MTTEATSPANAPASASAWSEAAAAPLRALIATLPEFAYVVAEDGETIVACNHVLAETLGQPSVEACLGRPLSALFRRPSSRTFIDENRRVLQTGEPFVHVEESVLPLGPRVMEVRKHAIGADGNGPRGVFVALRDITDRERAEAETRRMATLLARTVALTRLASAEIDLGDGSVLVSAPLVALLGAAPRTVRALMHGLLRTALRDDRAAVLAATREIARIGRAPFADPDAPPMQRDLITTSHLDPAGETRWIAWRIERLPPDDASVARTLPSSHSVRLLLTGLDISERRRLEHRVSQAQKLESIGRLAGGIAHDYNNLLTAIIGYVDLLGAALPAASPLRADVQEIGGAARRAADLTAQLLAVARRQVTTARAVPPEAVLELHRPLLGRLLGADVRLVIDVQPGVWPILGDESTLQHVVLTLVANARDAIVEGGTVRLSLANVFLHDDELAHLAEPTAHAAMPEASHVVPGEYVRLRVEDDGTGMSPGTIARLFEPFFTTKAVGEGTGLGLATLFGSVRQGGGFVHVTSREGDGSVFSVYFPRAAAPSDTSPSDTSPSTPDAATTLVVGTLSGASRTALRVAGRRDVIVATDVAAALRMMPGHERPLGDVIILDDVSPADAALLIGTIGRLHPYARLQRAADVPTLPAGADR